VEVLNDSRAKVDDFDLGLSEETGVGDIPVGSGQ